MSFKVTHSHCFLGQRQKDRRGWGYRGWIQVFTLRAWRLEPHKHHSQILWCVHCHHFSSWTAWDYRAVVAADRHASSCFNNINYTSLDYREKKWIGRSTTWHFSATILYILSNHPTLSSKEGQWVNKTHSVGAYGHHFNSVYSFSPR